MNGYGGSGMAKFTMPNMDKYIKQLEGLQVSEHEICIAAVYAGAKIVADEIRREIDGLDRVTDVEAITAWNEKRPVKISVSQKNGLRKGLGIAPIRNNYSIIGTKVGFSGYNDVETERWPNGQPNQMIAGACESGSTAMIKQPFVRTATKRVTQTALIEMERAADKKLKEILGGNAND